MISLFKFLALASSFSLVGIFLSLAFLLEEIEGYFQEAGNKLKRLLPPIAAIWVLSTIGLFLSELALIVNRPLLEVFNGNLIRSFALQVILGKVLLISIIAALVVLVAVNFIKRTGGAVALMVITFLGLLAPYLENHNASSGHHMLAVGLVVVHVLALALWIGGLIALVMMGTPERNRAHPRFHQIALWSLAAVALTGALNGWIRLGSISNIGSSYGLLLLGKSILLMLIFTVAFTSHRRNKERVNERSLTRQLSIEGVLFVITMSMGIALGQIAPPQAESDAVIHPILGSPMPQAPTFARLLWGYEPNGLFLAFLVLLVALYIRGVVVLTRRGDKWPINRTIFFALGISVADFAVNGGLGVYSHVAFSFHMVAHMALATVAPIGIVLGAPITLALRTLPIGRTPQERGVRGFALALLHSRYSRFLTNPIVAMLIFDGSMFALYFTDLFKWLMGYHFGHFFMEMHFFIAGFLFFASLIGVDPIPNKFPFVGRIVVILAAMSIHAFFSISLMSSSVLVDGGYFASLGRPWWPDLLGDQRTGAAIGWAFGEVPILLALAATFVQWVRSDSNEAARIERNSERARQAGVPDEVDKYNEYLKSLDEGNRRDNQR
jgi:cytochrome c oxidase assembly factor CtaG/putative copper export protein